jgi:hypothetical protein
VGLGKQLQLHWLLPLAQFACMQRPPLLCISL